MGVIRYHNVYSNSDIEFITAVINNLLSNGMKLSLINGGPCFTKITENEANEKAIGKLLSLSGHDVLNAQIKGTDLISIIFEKVTDGDSREDAPNVVYDIRASPEKYRPVVLDILRESATGFEKRPTALEMMRRKKYGGSGEVSYLVKRLEERLRVQSSLISGDGGLLYIKDFASFEASNKRITEGVEEICSRSYEVMSLNGNKMFNVTQNPNEWSHGDRLIVRANGAVAGVLKILPYDEDQPSQKRVCLLNGVWTSSFNIYSVISKMNGVREKQNGKVVDEDALLSHYLDISNRFEGGAISRCTGENGLTDERDILADYILTVFAIMKHRGIEISRENVYQQYFKGGISDILTFGHSSHGRDDTEKNLVNTYKGKLILSPIYRKIDGSMSEGTKNNPHKLRYISSRVANYFSKAVSLEYKCITSNLL